jgi:hypothetical protein
MKKLNMDMEDELRPEYSLKSLSIRKIGHGRKSFGEIIRLEPDIAAVFSDAEAVNEALRSLIKIANKSKRLASRST